MNIVTFSEDKQSGGSGDDPFESIFYTPSTSGTYCLRIKHQNGAFPGWVQLQSFSGESLERTTKSHALGNPAETKSSGALAVGASPWFNTNAYFVSSSRGPLPDGTIKPDIMGVSGIATASYGATVYGTSFAAPHIAGLAALVKQRYPSRSPSSIASYLKIKRAQQGREAQQQLRARLRTSARAAGRHAYAHTDTHAQSHINSYRHRDIHANRNINSHTQPNSNSYTYRHADRYYHSYTHANTHSRSRFEAWRPRCNTDLHPYSYPYFNASAKPYSDSHQHARCCHYTTAPARHRHHRKQRRHAFLRSPQDGGLYPLLGRQRARPGVATHYRHIHSHSQRRNPYLRHTL